MRLVSIPPLAVLPQWCYAKAPFLVPLLLGGGPEPFLEIEPPPCISRRFLTSVRFSVWSSVALCKHGSPVFSRRFGTSYILFYLSLSPASSFPGLRAADELRFLDSESVVARSRRSLTSALSLLARRQEGWGIASYRTHARTVPAKFSGPRAISLPATLRPLNAAPLPQLAARGGCWLGLPEEFGLWGGLSLFFCLSCLALQTRVDVIPRGVGSILTGSLQIKSNFRVLRPSSPIRSVIRRGGWGD